MYTVVVNINLRIRKLINGAHSNGKAQFEMIIFCSVPR